MKRFLITLCLSALLGGIMHAQSYGDTVDVRHRLPGFYYSGWWADHELDSTVYPQMYYYYSVSEYRYHYSEVPLRVEGIAAVIGNFVGGMLNNPFYDSTWAPEYLMLCEATPNSFDTLMSVHVNLRDTHKYVAQVVRDGTIHCCEAIDPHTEYYPLYIFYFDTPVVVYDSFYVGATHNSEKRLNENPTWPYVLFSILGWERPYSFNCTDSCFLTDKYLAEQNGQWFYREGPITFMIYPIAVPDTCHIVDGLRIVDWECGEEVVLTWDADDQHNGWEVAYGPAGTPPDSCTVVQCDITSVELDNSLEAGVGYVAYVRGVCGNKNTQYYSEWSDGIEVLRLNKYHVEAVANNAERGSVYGGGDYCDGDTAVLTARPWSRFVFLRWVDGSTENPRRVVVTQDTAFTAIFVSHEAIEAVPEGDAGFSLMPNPAWGSVSCALHDAGLAGGTLTVVNALGQEVLRKDVAPQTQVVELSVENLPQGVYYVTLTTPRLTTMQKLLVK